MSDDKMQTVGRLMILFLFLLVVTVLLFGCDTINYYNPHAGCTEVWVLEGFRWDEKGESWVVKPGHRPKKLIWKQDWDCNGQN